MSCIKYKLNLRKNLNDLLSNTTTTFLHLSYKGNPVCAVTGETCQGGACMCGAVATCAGNNAADGCDGTTCTCGGNL